MRVSQDLILLPVIVQVVLTFVVLVGLAIARARSLSEKGLSVQESTNLGDMDWSPRARQYAANYRNQFELPVLFFAACGLAYASRSVDIWLLGYATLFAVSRVLHTIMHVGPNIVAWRAAAFGVGYIALAAMWWLLALEILGRNF